MWKFQKPHAWPQRHSTDSKILHVCKTQTEKLYIAYLWVANNAMSKSSITEQEAVVNYSNAADFEASSWQPAAHYTLVF